MKPPLLLSPCAGNEIHTMANGLAGASFADSRFSPEYYTLGQQRVGTLYMRFGGNWLSCTASVINRALLLTAALCVCQHERGVGDACLPDTQEWPGIGTVPMVGRDMGTTSGIKGYTSCLIAVQHDPLVGLVGEIDSPGVGFSGMWVYQWMGALKTQSARPFRLIRVSSWVGSLVEGEGLGMWQTPDTEDFFGFPNLMVGWVQGTFGMGG